MTQITEDSLRKYIRQFIAENPTEPYLILDAVSDVLTDYKYNSYANKVRELAICLEEELREDLTHE